MKVSKDAKLLARLGNRLRKVREDKQLTQLEVAERVGIRDVSLSRYENCVRVPDVITVYKLCKLYGVSVESLID